MTILVLLYIAVIVLAKLANRDVSDVVASPADLITVEVEAKFVLTCLRILSTSSAGTPRPVKRVLKFVSAFAYC
jgi:Holliday junction resolvasome RuvABC ATP-dependent DNA helicase subunit